MSLPFQESEYPRGSEWTCWDLHIHTPLSIYQGYGGDQDAVWDQFVQEIANLPPEITVIGVTDYLFIDGYRKLIERRAEMPNIKMFLPNIEFRLSTFSGTANNNKRHNFHVLFDPSVDPDVIEEQLLRCISKGYKIADGSEWEQSPTRRSLTELGQEMKAVAPASNSIHQKTNLEVGADNITYNLDDLLKLLKKSVFKGKCLTAMGYSEWDQSRWDQSAAEKRDLINNSNFALVASPNIADVEDHQANLRANNIITPILHSSDAHDLSALKNSRLWIKADPTFAGLKQVLNEPDARICISDAPPIHKAQHQCISHVEISNSNGWFADDFSMDLNHDLAAVIGGRGSGKSALLEMLALGAGCVDDSGNAFIDKAMRHKNSIRGTRIKLTWGDGTITESEIGGQMPPDRLVRYLPQKFVEKLCDPDNNPDLLEQIENVIFQALDTTDKGDASDFTSLREDLLQNYRLRKNEIISDIQDKNSRYYQLKRLIDSLPGKQKDLEQKNKDLKKLNDSLPKLPPEQQKAQDEIAKLTSWQSLFENKIIEIRTTLNRIPEINTKIEIFKTNLSRNESEIINLLKVVGIEPTDIAKISFEPEKITSLLEQKTKELQDAINTLYSGDKDSVSKLISLEDAPALNLQEIKKLVAQKMNETKAYENLKRRYQQHKKEMLRLEKNIENLSKEIEEIQKVAIPESRTISSERFDLYSSYFDILQEEKIELESLYEPLQNSLQQGGTEADKRLKFEAQIHFDLEEHVEKGIEILDRTKKGQFRDVTLLRKTLGEMWDAFLANNFDKTAIMTEMKKLSDMFLKLDDGTDIRIEDQLKQVYTLEDFANWLLDLDAFKVRSSLKFDDVDLQFLSPGQKGIVLLLLYLQIDRTDNRPLLIDQPEDNLDNLSVYDDLITYFRQRKTFRQIVIATHNPNLVVNTDAEQVVIAKFDGTSTPRISYASGSLEHCATQPEKEGIIEKVCRILEGGKPAFIGRKKKYLLSDGSL